MPSSGWGGWLTNGKKCHRKNHDDIVYSRNNSAALPVLRSASFHSTAQVFGGGGEDDGRDEEFQDQGSTDEQEESGASSWASNHHSLLTNSPTQVRKDAGEQKKIVNRRDKCFSFTTRP